MLCCCGFTESVTFTVVGGCRKSFVETRSIGAVAVAFSRVYILHAILLCWMSLLVGVGSCRRMQPLHACSWLVWCRALSVIMLDNKCHQI